MITGVVTSDREAVIDLVVLGPTGLEEIIEAMIDTGFDGYLSLPPSIIGRLGLPWRGRGKTMLADGSDGVFDIYEGRILWDDQPVRIAIDAADVVPLVGMSLLEGYELKVEVRPDGRISIERLA